MTDINKLRPEIDLSKIKPDLSKYASEPKRDPLDVRPYGERDFEKVGQDVKLDDSPQTWPSKIISSFAEQHPYAYDGTAPEVEFEQIDEDSGSAFGAIILRKPYNTQGLDRAKERREVEPEKIAVPFVIKDFKLKPMLVFIRGNQTMPLTEGRFVAMNKSSSIAVGLDSYAKSSPLFVDKMLPSSVGYLGNFYGSQDGTNQQGAISPRAGTHLAGSPEEMTKESGSSDPAKSDTMLSFLRGTIDQVGYDNFRSYLKSNPRAVAGFAMNQTMNNIRNVLGQKPTSFNDRVDFVEKLAPTHVVYLEKLSNGMWKATETTDYFYKPVIRELKPGEVVCRYGDIEPMVMSLMSSSDQIILEATGRSHVRPVVLEEYDVVAEDAEEDGAYTLVTTGGGLVRGQIMTNVLDCNLNPLKTKLFVGDGIHSYQHKFVGNFEGDIHENLTEGCMELGDEGTFVGEVNEKLSALAPFKVTNLGKMQGYYVVQAVGFDNQYLTFVMMPGVQQFVNATGIADSFLGSHVGGSVFFVPPGFKYVSLGKRVQIHCDPREIKKSLYTKIIKPAVFPLETSKERERTLRVIADRAGHITLRGKILESLRRDCQVTAIEPIEAHYIMTLLGVPVEEAAKFTAMAVDSGEINVAGLQPVKDIDIRSEISDRGLKSISDSIRRNLSKVASTLADQKSVDTLLSLNFVNENNLMAFLQKLPELKDAESKLAELLLYTQLGLDEHVPEDAVASAMKSLNEVNESLDYLNSRITMPVSAGSEAQVEEQV